jgi:hypothetical protein
MSPTIAVAERAGVGLDGAERPSEDVVIVLPHAVIMLDGATSLRADLPSGGWYATRLAEAIAERLTAEPAAGLDVVLAAAIGAVAAEHGFVAGRSPSSTVALLRWTGDAVDALVLGDSPVIAFGPGGPTILADDRLTTIPRGGGGYRTRLRSGGGYGPDHVDALRVSGAAMDRWRNREGGFWVAEADPRAAYQARRTSWPRAQVHAALLATDGVACGVDDYRIFPDWLAVLELSRTDGPHAILDAVRAAERSDPHGTRWPRPKPHDDQALALITFSMP